MDQYQYQQIALHMRSLNLNIANPAHYAFYMAQQAAQQAAHQPIYAANRTGPPVNITNGWVVTEARGVFVSNLNFQANEAAISTYFARAGTIVCVVLSRDPHTRRSKGNCTIEFDSAASAQKAIRLFNGRPFMDMNLHVRLGRDSTPKDAPSRNAPAPAQPSRRDDAPPTIVSSTPTQSRRTAPR